jgi:hypothetical protein
MSAFSEQFESLVSVFEARKVEVRGSVVRLIKLSVVEKYVLSTAISLGRCNADEVPEVSADLYRMTWERDLTMCVDTQREVLRGLDNYVCDTGGIIHSVEDGDYTGDLIDFDVLVQLNETARVLYKVVENVFDAYYAARTERIVQLELDRAQDILDDMMVDADVNWLNGEVSIRREAEQAIKKATKLVKDLTDELNDLKYGE